VDDEALQRQLVAEDLLLNGYRVFQAGNAFQALALLSSPEMFDLVLTDIDMPGDFNGIDLARLVKDTAPATKVILISGRDHAPGNIASIDLHLRKPITSVRLRAVIARMLEPASPLERPSA
jgi:DNA-binding NtrC family response regulator